MQLSVLMSVYNATQAEDLNRCLQSLATQSLPPNQVVLVRDGEVDATVEECIKTYESRLPLHHLRFPRNRGLGHALRDGLHACDHEIIARVDSDDWSAPERFSLQVQYLIDNPSISVVGGWLKEHYPDRKRTVGVVRQTPLDHTLIKNLAKRRNPLNHPTVMFRKSHVLGSGSYQPCMLFEDYFLWARMLMSGYQLANLPHVLVETSVDPQYFSRRGGFAYIRNEFNLLLQLSKIGFLSPVDMVIFFLSRIPIRILPIRTRQNFYKSFLRHN